MTLIVGIKCEDAVILASDSQITASNSKRTDSTKIEAVEFVNFPVLVAQSGSLIHSNRYVDILSKLAWNVTAHSADEVGKVIQAAMYQLRSELREMHFGCNSEELSGIMLREGIDCGIMAAFWINDTPHLITISLAQPLYRRSRFFYEAAGCGEALGQYMLAENASPEMDVENASLIAAYVVETVKKHDAFCGGPTKIAAIAKPKLTTHGAPKPRIVNFPEDKINSFIQWVDDAERVTKAQRAKLIKDKLEDHAAKVRAEWEKLLE